MNRKSANPKYKKVGSRFMLYLVNRKRITPESSSPSSSSSSSSWCGIISSKGSCVEDGGAKKLPLLLSRCWKLHHFSSRWEAVVARRCQCGCSQSPTFLKGEGRVWFDCCVIAWPKLARTLAVRFRRFNAKGPWGHDATRLAALTRGTQGFRRGTVASNFFRFTLASDSYFGSM
jgi:hypothetical protein